MQLSKYPEIKMLFHIANEGKRSWQEGKRMKRAGMSAGVPDWFLAVPRKGYCGLFIEQKSSSGKVTANQSAWLRNLSAQGYLAVICVGQDAVRDCIESYLGK